MVTRTVYKTSKKDILKHDGCIRNLLNKINWRITLHKQEKFILRFEFVKQKDFKQVFAFRVYNTDAYTITAGTSTMSLVEHLSLFINKFIDDKFEPFLLSKNQVEELDLCRKALLSFCRW